MDKIEGPKLYLENPFKKKRKCNKVLGYADKGKNSELIV